MRNLKTLLCQLSKQISWNTQPGMPLSLNMPPKAAFFYTIYNKEFFKFCDNTLCNSIPSLLQFPPHL